MSSYLTIGSGLRSLLVTESTQALITPDDILSSWMAQNNDLYTFHSALNVLVPLNQRKAFVSALDRVPLVASRFENESMTLERLRLDGLRIPDSLRHSVAAASAEMKHLVGDLCFDTIDEFSSQQLDELVSHLSIKKLRATDTIHSPEHLVFVLSGSLVLSAPSSSKNQSAFSAGQTVSESLPLVAKSNSIIGLVSQKEIQKIKRDHELIERQRTIDFFSTNPPFSLIPRYRLNMILPFFAPHSIIQGRKLPSNSTDVLLVLRGRVRVHGTITLKGYLPGHQIVSEKPVELRVFRNIPLFDVQTGQLFGLTETTFGHHTRLLGTQAILSDVAVHPLEDGKLLSISKGDLTTVCSMLLDFNMGMFHIALAIKSLEEHALQKVLTVLDKDDFDRYSGQYLQDPIALARTFSDAVLNLPVMRELASVGRVTQEKEAAKADTYRKLNVSKDRLENNEPLKESWTKSPVRLATAKGRYFRS